MVPVRRNAREIALTRAIDDTSTKDAELWLRRPIDAECTLTRIGRGSAVLDRSSQGYYDEWGRFLGSRV